MVAAELGTKRNDRTLCNLASTCKAWKQLAEKSLGLAKEKYRAVCGDELAGMTDARRDLVRFVESLSSSPSDRENIADLLETYSL